MSNLVAFGCSHTAGHALPDHHLMCNVPSKFAWPQILANILEKDCVNKGICGASSTEILLEILNYPFLKDDEVVVMWTFVGREVIISENQQHIQLMPNAPACSEPYEHYLKLHPAYDLNYRTWLTMHHAFMHLLNLRIKFHFCTVVPMPPLLEVRPAWAQCIKLLDFNGNIYHTYPRALDNMHPGVECHERYAYNLFHSMY